MSWLWHLLNIWTLQHKWTSLFADEIFLVIFLFKNIIWQLLTCKPPNQLLVKLTWMNERMNESVFSLKQCYFYKWENVCMLLCLNTLFLCNLVKLKCTSLKAYNQSNLAMRHSYITVCKCCCNFSKGYIYTRSIEISISKLPIPLYIVF